MLCKKQYVLYKYGLSALEQPELVVFVKRYQDADMSYHMDNMDIMVSNSRAA